jgi:hypothetical protein
MCGENLKLIWRGRLSVLVVGHTLYTIVSSVLSTVYQLMLNVLQWKDINISIYSYIQAWNNYAKLLEHGNIRCLFLGPSIDRIVSMFDGLRSYFLSQENCPVMLLKFFEDPCLKLWLSFARDQVSTFQTYTIWSKVSGHRFVAVNGSLDVTMTALTGIKGGRKLCVAHY